MKSVERARREEAVNGVVPDAFWMAGGATGVLMLHGFTGSASEMRRVGAYVHKQGFTVSAPLLPGHGTTPADINQRGWREWCRHAEEAWVELRSRCDQAFVVGQSMGALLAFQVAAKFGSEVAGVVAYAPAIFLKDKSSYLTPLAKYFIKEVPHAGDDFVDKEAANHLWCYGVHPIPAVHELLRLIWRTKRVLPKIACPVLVLHSTRDQVVEHRSAQYVYDRVASSEKEVVLLHNSGHVLALDAEWEIVAEHSVQFMRRYMTSAR